MRGKERARNLSRLWKSELYYDYGFYAYVSGKFYVGGIPADSVATLPHADSTWR